MDMVRQFQNMLMVFEKGSLGKAADALHISQPALTKSVRRLEQRLGVPLFYRDSKGMRPTIYGETLRAHAQEITVGVNQAFQDIQALRDGSAGTIRVAAGPLVTSDILLEAVINLKREQPGLRVNIHTTIGDTRAELMSGNFDFILALLRPGAPPSGLLQRPLINDRIALIARRGNPLTQLKRVRPRDLADASWVLPVAGHYHRRRLESVFEAENLPSPVPSVECSATDFIKTMVQRTDHIGVVARMGLRAGGENEIEEIPLQSPFLVRPIGIVWRKHHVLSKSSRMLIDAVVNVCDAISSDIADEPVNAVVPERRASLRHVRHE